MANRKISNDCLGGFLEEDFTQAEIGRACEMTREGVRRRIQAAGVSYGDILLRRRKALSSPIRGLAEKGHTAIEISEILSLPILAVRQRINNYKIRVKDDRFNYKKRAEILFLRIRGFSKKEISEELGFSFQEISGNRMRDITNQKFVDGKKGYVK